MSNHKFIKLFKVNGTEVLIRKTFEMLDGKQQILIVVHCFFDEFIPLGYMPEAISKIAACCIQHQNEKFDRIDGNAAKAPSARNDACLNY